MSAFLNKCCTFEGPVVSATARGPMNHTLGRMTEEGFALVTATQTGGLYSDSAIVPDQQGNSD